MSSVKSIYSDTTQASKHKAIPVMVKYFPFPVDFSPAVPKNNPGMANNGAVKRHDTNIPRVRINIMLIIPDAREMAPFLKPASDFWLVLLLLTLHFQRCFKTKLRASAFWTNKLSIYPSINNAPPKAKKHTTIAVIARCFSAAFSPIAPKNNPATASSSAAPPKKKGRYNIALITTSIIPMAPNVKEMALFFKPASSFLLFWLLHIFYLQVYWATTH